MIGRQKKKNVEIRKVLCLVKNYSYSMSERKRSLQRVKVEKRVKECDSLSEGMGK